jgi:hypothetical protein
MGVICTNLANYGAPPCIAVEKSILNGQINYFYVPNYPSVNDKKWKENPPDDV